jgi:hypothetical protein
MRIVHRVARYCRNGGMVDAHDSKSCIARCEGSSPSSGTTLRHDFLCRKALYLRTVREGFERRSHVWYSKQTSRVRQHLAVICLVIAGQVPLPAQRSFMRRLGQHMRYLGHGERDASALTKTSQTLFPEILIALIQKEWKV